MSLADLQRSLTAYIQTEEQQPLGSIADQSQRGLPVYHYAYRASLIAALRDVFERAHCYIGDDGFDDAARTHIASNPPSSWTMADYGIGFEKTLDALYPENPEVGELAWLDWQLRIAFNGPDAPPLDVAGLGEIDWETAPLNITPTLVMRTVSTNVASLWSALDDEDANPPAAELLEQPVTLTVWRQILMPRFHSIEPMEKRALSMAQNGASFGQICTALADDEANNDDVTAFAGAMLGRWISEALLVGASHNAK